MHLFVDKDNTEFVTVMEGKTVRKLSKVYICTKEIILEHTTV